MLSYRQTSYWRDSYSLFSHAVEVSPRTWATRLGLADQLLKRKQFDIAEQRLREAIEIYPSSRTYLALGRFFLIENRPADAIEPLQKALQFEPGIENGRLGLAEAFFKSGRRIDAQRALEQVLREHPDDQRAANMMRAVESGP